MAELRKYCARPPLLARLHRCCAASYHNKGVQPLLDAICAYMPSPLDIPSIVGSDPRTAICCH